MGKLIIDKNAVFEIDEECLKKRPPVKGCDISQYFTQETNEQEHEKNYLKESDYRNR